MLTLLAFIKVDISLISIPLTSIPLTESYLQSKLKLLTEYVRNLCRGVHRVPEVRLNCFVKGFTKHINTGPVYPGESGGDKG